MKLKKIISIIFYILAAMFLFIYAFVEITPNLMMSEMARLFLLGCSCIFLYVGALIKSKVENNNKAMNVNLWIFFVLYLILLITLTLFDPMWGRNGFDLSNWTKGNIDIYLENSINLIPFKTIIRYANNLFVSLLDTSTIFLNLFGNLVCLTPLALFIPLLFKKVDNTKKFLISILCVTLSIELIQLITFSGSCDIDDIILNTLGALMAYKILNIEDIKNLAKNIFLLEKNKVNKKKVIIIVSIILIACASILGLYKISERFYQKNLDEFTSKRNYKIEIIDESEATDQALEKFYEDELFEYYFPSIRSDYVYAIINGTEKYLVKDLLNNNPTDYVVSIDRLKRAGLQFIKQEKYTKLDVSIQGNVNLDEQISNKEIFELGFGYQGYGITETTFELYIIPKNSGKATLTLNFYSSDINKFNELAERKEYEIIVNKTMTVEVKEK